MYVELTTSQVVDRLLADEYAGWTYEEARALAEYYEYYEDSTGEKIEFDPVYIRGNWNKYEDEAEAEEAYGMRMSAIEARTEVLLVEGGGLLVGEF